MRDQVFRTRITDFFGIRHPILAGGLMWLADARYVAAVVNAGAMGFVTALAFPDADEFQRQIRLCRELTGGKPFGVNLAISRRPEVNARLTRHVDIAIEERVPFVETSGSSPLPLMERFRAAGMRVIHKVPAVRYAITAERDGADAISVIGAESGGHPGYLMMGTMVQAALASRSVTLPLVIGGGIGTGRQIFGALAMSADGVVMGSRFVVAEEIWAHRDYKKRMVAGDGTDSRVVMQIFRDHHRVLDNDAARAVAKLEAEGITDFEAYRPHVMGTNTRRAYETGDLSQGMVDYGQAMAFADAVKPVEAIIDELIDDAVAARERLASLSAACVIPGQLAGAA